MDKCKNCGAEFDPGSWKLYHIEESHNVPFWIVWKYGDYCSDCKIAINEKNFEKKFWLKVLYSALALVVIFGIIYLING